jgi:hypothetical protein
VTCLTAIKITGYTSISAKALGSRGTMANITRYRLHYLASRSGKAELVRTWTKISLLHRLLWLLYSLYNFLHSFKKSRNFCFSSHLIVLKLFAWHPLLFLLIYVFLSLHFWEFRFKNFHSFD